MLPKIGQKLKVIEADYDLAVGQIVEVIPHPHYTNDDYFWVNGSSKFPFGLCFSDVSLGDFEVLSEAPSYTTSGEAETLEVNNIMRYFDHLNSHTRFATLIQVLVSNGTLTLEQVKRALGDSHVS